MPLPALREILLEHPLYSPLTLSAKDADAVDALTRDRFRFDGYCIDCEDRTIFYDNRTNHYSPSDTFAERIISLPARCGRNPEHTLIFYLLIQRKQLTKIGQHPSHADLSNPDLKKYQKILGRQRAVELHRAIGLAAHGVGIGSYAYLRRIFEDLLSQHRKEVEDANGPIAKFSTMRVDEKIHVLREALPETLVRNRNIYGILSKGIHELSEEQCLLLFPVLRDGIIMILEQDRVARERREQEARLQAALAKVAAAMNDVPPEQRSESSAPTGAMEGQENSAPSEVTKDS